MEKPVFRDSLVAYIDLLGVSDACLNEEESIRLVEISRDFKKYHREFEHRYEGQTTLQVPAIFSFSDSVVISMPISEEVPLNLQVDNLNRVIARFAMIAYSAGFLIRGAISLGKMYHENDIIVGKALCTAVTAEKEKGSPGIVIHTSVVDKLNIAPGGFFYCDTLCLDELLGIVSSQAIPHEDKKVFLLKLSEIIEENIVKLTAEKNNSALKKWHSFEARYKRFRETPIVKSILDE